MKKSQLRNIIRESIKGLMNEQSGYCGITGPVGSNTNYPNCTHSTSNSQQACSNIQGAFNQAFNGTLPMSTFGINQNYHDNCMNAYNNNGCNALLSKRNQKWWQMDALINNGLHTSGYGKQPLCAGDNPIHQSRLYNRGLYAWSLYNQLCP